jgi:hypothetical protein
MAQAYKFIWWYIRKVDTWHDLTIDKEAREARITTTFNMIWSVNHYRLRL